MSLSSSAGDADKAALRRQALARRSAIARDVADAASCQIADNFLKAVPLPSGLIVAGYRAMRGEVDPALLMTLLAGRGLLTALPVVTGKGRSLLFRCWRDGDALEAGPYGTWHPAAGARAVRPDLLLVPLLAFDLAGHRLGYGGGYYDRTLAAGGADRPTAVGLAFARQRIEGLPHERHDEPLDWIVTEEEAREFKR